MREKKHIYFINLAGTINLIVSMKLSVIILLSFLLVNFSFSQEFQNNTVVLDYEQLLNEIDNDTLIKQRTARYECSEDFFGEVNFFYKKDSLRLIKHIFKQGFYEDYTIENYYIKGDSLLLQTVFTEITHLNTNNYQSNNGSYVSSVEKFLELIEERRVIKSSNSEMDCYQRSYGRKVSEWDQDYFNTLEFSKVTCYDNLEEVTDKFKLLRKAERKFLQPSHKSLPCIFYIW